MTSLLNQINKGPSAKRADVSTNTCNCVKTILTGGLDVGSTKRSREIFAEFFLYWHEHTRDIKRELRGMSLQRKELVVTPIYATHSISRILMGSQPIGCGVGKIKGLQLFFRLYPTGT